MPLLNGKSLERKLEEPFHYYNCENLQAIRSGNWKLHLSRKQEQLPHWDKNKVFHNIDRPVLYNLSIDPGESTDVAGKHPEVVSQMLKQVEEASKDLGEYLRRGKGQRPTGSAIPDAPIIGNEKDWRVVDPVMNATLLQERKKRHLGFATRKKKRRKK